MAEDWITTTEACKLSGYHPYYLREIIRRGKIQGRKFGTIWQVDRQSLLNYMDESEHSQDKRKGAKKVPR